MEITGDFLTPSLRTALRPLLLPSLRLRVSGEAVPDSTGTRFGGVPLLAGDAPWPRSAAGRPLSFLGQLNSTDVNTRLGATLLPPDTLLSFFYDLHEEPWGFDPADASGSRVLVTPQAAAHPRAAPAEAASFPAHATVATPARTLPDRWDSPPGRPLAAALHEGVEAFYDAAEEQDEDVPRHRVFGWPELVQGPMQLECQLVTNGIYCGDPDGYRDPRVADLRAGARDWLLLWQIDTDEDAGWAWGDAGTLYYWIHRDDLATGDFDRVWLIQQCC